MTRTTIALILFPIDFAAASLFFHLMVPRQAMVEVALTLASAFIVVALAPCSPRMEQVEP